VRTLITPCYLVGTPDLWKDADVNMLDVRTSDRDRHHVLRFAGGCARMATDAARVIDYFGPLYSLSVHQTGGTNANSGLRAQTISPEPKKRTSKSGVGLTK
jgi:hypothetical protein